MKIAQIAPLYESVPPKLYGGTERIVSYLTEELVRLGHEVHLFASGDSKTAAIMYPQCDQSLRLNGNGKDPLIYHMLMTERIAQMIDRFDIIHSHIDYITFPVFRRVSANHVTTLHGRLDMEELQPLYDEFNDMPVVSISKAQQTPLPQADWVGTVHHGLPKDLFKLQKNKKNYLAFLGRISPEKRVDRAIEIAKKTGIKLKIAAKISDTDQEYFEAQIKPLLDDSLIEFIGEIGEKDKQEFLGNATALLFPIDWPEPFGLVLIEAMACGTPVVAFRKGSVEEIIVNGKNGFIVDNIEEAVNAVRKLNTISHEKCRNYFEEHFSSTRMARNYLEIYNKIQKRKIINVKRTLINMGMASKKEGARNKEYDLTS